MIAYMHTNSNESGGNIHKNTNTQPIQINATAEEQGRNNVTVDNITCKDIPLNQTQTKEHRNEELRRHQVIENRSIITIETNSLNFVRNSKRSLQKLKNLMYHLTLICMKYFCNVTA